jgi:hypothetical protein
MFVTRHNSVVERGLLERLWDLYELAYRRTAEESASREMFFRSEFDAAVADPSNRLWVLWADDEPVAMVLIATDIGSTRYLSQPFFERGVAVKEPLHEATGSLFREILRSETTHRRNERRGVRRQLQRESIGFSFVAT